MDQGFRDLRVFQLAYTLAMEIFEISKQFPKAETYSLTDQIRRSSRSVCSNIAEGYRKRIYPKHFTSKLTDADSECSETSVWISFARDCGYISSDQHDTLQERYTSVGAMLGKMIRHPYKFSPRSR
jgi:four helix bundle protein